MPRRLRNVCEYVYAKRRPAASAASATTIGATTAAINMSTGAKVIRALTNAILPAATVANDDIRNPKSIISGPAAAAIPAKRIIMFLSGVGIWLNALASLPI